MGGSPPDDSRIPPTICLPSSPKTMACKSPLLSLLVGAALAVSATAQTFDFASSAQTISETAGTTVATIQLSEVAAVDVEVTLTLSGSATEGVDYTVSPNPVVITAGGLTADATITLTDDALFELDETAVLTLSAPVGATLGSITEHTVSVQSDDPQPRVRFGRFRSLSNEGVGAVQVAVLLTEPAGVDIQVDFVTTGRAIFGSDFDVVESPVTIPAGTTDFDLTVTIFDDSLRENPERLRLNLTGADFADLGSPVQHTMAIVDNDLVTPGIATRAVAADSGSLEFLGPIRVGDESTTQRVIFNNPNFTNVTVTDLRFLGDGQDFTVDVVGPELPRVLAPADRLAVDIRMGPQSAGLRQSDLVVFQTPHPTRPRTVSVEGQAIGLTGEELLLNAGGSEYVDFDSNPWIPDYLFSGGTATVTALTFDISDTIDDQLYVDSRVGTSFNYALPMPNGQYEVLLRFVEPRLAAAGLRVFDVEVEGALEVDDLDVFATVGRWAAFDVPVAVTIDDGVLDLQFTASVGNALISAIGIRTVPIVDITPDLIDFVTVEQGQLQGQGLTISNSGSHVAQLARVSLTATLGSAEDFSIEVGGESLVGDIKSVSYSVDETIAPGEVLDLDVTFAPLVHDDHVVTLRFEGNFPPMEVTLLGTGGADADWGFLHPVLSQFPALAVDYDGSGTERIEILGEQSHTHEPGHVLTGFDWQLNGAPLASTTNTARILPVGDSSVELTITDDNDPGNTASDTRVYSVFPGDGVPGVLASYFSVADPIAALDSVPAIADFIERRSAVGIPNVLGLVGGSPFSDSVMAKLEARFDVPVSGSYEFLVSGGADHRVIVDGTLLAGPAVLSPGTHDLEIRVAVLGLADLAVDLDVTVDGSSVGGFDTDLVHNELGIVPVVHDMPTLGIDLGGNLIGISGFGFYPGPDVTVHWGTQDFVAADFLSFDSGRIEFLSPPGTGQINVTVETPAGTSQPRIYTYSPTGPVPIDFDRLDANQVDAPGVSTGEWGPDGRFYVGQINGEIKAITYDEDYVPIDVQTYVGVSNLTNHDILSIAFNPWDPPSPVKIYVGHGEHFLNGGGAFTGPSPYTGEVSVLTGPDFGSPVTLIENLPTSNHDHAINGMVFDNNGDLLVCVGGNTNAGVKAPLIGDLPESPLSGAIIKAETSRPDFNGILNYLDRVTLAVANDQIFGEDVELEAGSHVGVHAHGLRNPYDLCLTTWGHVYATDNGPNNNFGPASTGPNSQTSDPSDGDELLLVEFDHYYGHANRSRGFSDPRQNIYRGTSQPSIPGDFTQQIAPLQSSTNGIVEYRATTFNSQMRGELIVQKWNFRQRRVTLSDDRRSVEAITDIFPQANGLDVTVGPGGAMLVMNYSGNQVEIMVPNDVSIVGLRALDIFPWRAPSGGGTPFVIGGEGFGDLTDTTVTIGGIPATLTEVTSRRIKGLVPASSAPTDLVDVVVNVGSTPSVLTEAFRYLAPAPGQGTGFWTDGPSMPASVGEVSCAAIDGTMYLVGETSPATFAYDIESESWVSNLAQRPFVGNHHGSEVVDGKWYLIGGLTSGAGTLQIYDPVLNSWSVGPPLSWAGGSIATAAHDGKIYAFGGIVGSATVVNAAVYDPQTDAWTALPNMPTGVNHAAAGSDGERIFVFGGRGGGNTPQPGFTTVQAFDPVLMSWDSSDMPGSELAPMPSGRGGTGSAVLFRGEFLIFGGETNDAFDAEATGDRVFPQVFAYDPQANTWRRDKDMTTPRHGMYPVLFGGRIFVAGGGTVFGFSQSDVLEILNF